jgi:hypothetical protein
MTTDQAMQPEQKAEIATSVLAKKVSKGADL